VSVCNCDCSYDVRDLKRTVERLTDELRTLDHRTDALQRDLARETIDRQDAVRSVRSDVTDFYLQVQS
jgi:hypothetical protein